ncbi:MAG: hypothetical protein EZS28_002820 [Streblomastix strix]|uniref:RRM domain-containing protein n=1 Tax=Streblomastix strix TaxID=222440 RepID=A0A5J4X4E2_9EUKA|nr:MAG: hypothetical protein EZS28_002820 [Streblomastix strix]
MAEYILPGTSERTICKTGHKINPGLDYDETKRCIFILGKIHIFSDDEIWDILAKRGKLEKILLKYNIQTGSQKGFAFAVYKSEQEMDRVLAQGQIIDIRNIRIFLNKMQQSTNIMIYSIKSNVPIEKMAEEACSYGQVVNLEVMSIAGGKTLFIEYNKRLDAEQAKSGLCHRFTGKGGYEILIKWADSKILNNCLHIRFQKQLNDKSGKVVNEKSITQLFAKYGAVKRVEFLRDAQFNILGDAFVSFENNASGQVSALSFMQDLPLKTIQIGSIQCTVKLRLINETNRYCTLNTGKGNLAFS